MIELASDLTLVASKVEVAGVDRFIADQTSIKKANIGWTGEIFQELFLGKVEENVRPRTVKVQHLENKASDDSIRRTLGPRNKILLAHFFDLLENQSDQWQGPLLFNGYANVAYIHDRNRNVGVAHAVWYPDGHYWLVDAFALENPDGWEPDRRFLSFDH